MLAMIVALLAVATQFFPQPVMMRPATAAGTINTRSPLSAGVLVARAVRFGQIRPGFSYRQVFPNILTCTPAPCVTPNVQASGGGQPVNETPIAANPVNNRELLSGGNDYNCGGIQGFYASHNGGTSWTRTCLGQLPGTGGVGDPIVGYDTVGNSFIGGIDEVNGNTAEIAMETSTNGGTSWSSAHLAITGISPYTFVDKPWLQVDDSAVSSRKDALYVSTTEFDPNSNSAIAVAHSTDHGVTFKNVEVDAVVFPTVDQFSDLGIGADGTVYLSWMRCSATGPTGDCGGTTAMMMFSKSTDGGVTWSAPVAMTNAGLAPDTCGAFYGCLPGTGERVSDLPAIDVDRTSGTFANRLYTAYYNWTGSQMQVKLTSSANGGTTWSSPIRVAPRAPHDEFMPWVTTNAKGFVGVTQLDRRLDPSNFMWDAFAEVSKDGGAHFATGVRLSSVSSNPNNDGFGDGFIGDYTGNIWVRNTVYMSWPDTRTGVAQDEVGGYKL